MTREVVIASYKENLDWVKSIPRQWMVTVYSTSNGTLPNVGREAGQWLHHLVSRYDSLSDMTVFLQGDKAHNPKEIDLLLDNPPEGFGYVGLKNPVSNLGICEPSRRLLEKAWGNEPIPKPTSYMWGGQFYVSKSIVLRRPKDHYKNLLDAVRNPVYPIDGAYLLEPYWSSVFSV